MSPTRTPAARIAPRPPARGFTLIEGAIVMAIAAVLLRVAAPPLAREAATAALATQASEFVAALRFARAEAVKRGERVTLCAADVAPEPRCRAAAAVDWRAGWIVFVDRGQRGRIDDGDTVLRLHQPLGRSGGVVATRGALSFSAGGFGTDAASRYRFEPPPGPFAAPPARLVCVSKQGRARTILGEDCQ